MVQRFGGGHAPNENKNCSVVVVVVVKAALI